MKVDQTADGESGYMLEEFCFTRNKGGSCNARTRATSAPF